MAMKYENHKESIHHDTFEEWDAELDYLDKILKEKQVELAEVESDLEKVRRQFQTITDAGVWNWIQLANETKTFMRTTASYLLGKRNRKDHFSNDFRKKDAEDKFKSCKYHLYQLGFREKASAELEKMFKETSNQYLKSAIAWELALWFANKGTKYGASKALAYISSSVQKKKDEESLRKAAIIKAECHWLLNEKDVGRRFLQEIIQFHKHPDLYLARANLEEGVENKIEWINQALEQYEVNPILLSKNQKKKDYDRLKNGSVTHVKTKEPKVTVIIPAFNAEQTIETAIHSILEQTWENIELIIVDDCSRDRTAEIVRSYTNEDNRIKLFSTSENSGPYAARNIALKNADGDFVTIHDADDWSHAQKIEIQVKHLLANPEVLGNTSQQIRLEEDLRINRRGLSGAYIFTNLSSLMFRKKPVVEKIGYWDEVRFGSDGEFVERLKHTFGENIVVNLSTGPLSFTRQSEKMLTGSNVFGYNGFLMGARKEYMEAYHYFHKTAGSLYFPSGQTRRLFPVPEPMWKHREEKWKGKRYFDVVIAGDFRISNERIAPLINLLKFNKQLGLKTGIVQKAYYDLKLPQAIHSSIREQIDGYKVHMLVYGESVTCENFIVAQAGTFQEEQLYLPDLQADMVHVVIDELPIQMNKNANYNFRDCAFNLEAYVGKRGVWYPGDEDIQEKINSNKLHDEKYINLSNNNWKLITKNIDNYKAYIENWTLDINPYLHDDQMGGNPDK